jgi:hypothetical protein
MEGGGEPHRRGVRGGLDGVSARRIQWKLSVSYSYELWWSYSRKEVIGGGS